ncbi:MAG: ComEC/Rec2 family competence protein [Streptobacillus sp.]
MFFGTKFTTISIEDIKTSNIYILNCIADGNKLTVNKVNGNNLVENIFIKNENDIPFGKYTLVFEVKYKKGRYIYGDILEIRYGKLNCLRLKIESLINNNIDNIGCQGLVKAIILSKKSDILVEDKEMFKNLGLMSFISISGLHIYILISLIRSMLINIFERMKLNILIVILLSLYSATICFPISVLRSYIMYISSILYKKIEDRFLISIVFVLGLNIYDVLNPSFIFSYLSVFILIYMFPNIDLLQIEIFKKNILKSIIFQIMLMPFQYYFLHQIGILFFLSNIIIAPFFTLFIFLSFLTMLLNFIHIYILNSLLVQVYIGLKNVCLLISKIPFISINVNNVSIFIFVLFIILDFLVFIRVYEIKLKNN